MKLKLVFYICIIFVLQSCYKAGDIQVQNNISNVKITNVQWGDIYIAYELLPGETSEKMSINKNTEKLPASYIVNFEMTANNKTVYLETKESFSLDEGGELLIQLDDDTKVNNTAEN